MVDQPEEDTNANGVIDEDEISELPGTPFDATRFPAMIRAWARPDADMDVTPDPPYGHSISGYAPIRGKEGHTTAIVGVDIMNHVLQDKMSRSIRLVAIYALAMGIMFAATMYAHYRSRTVMARIASINAELAQANLKMADTMRMRTELSRMIMHDIRSPLSVIVGNTSLLLSEPACFSADDTREMLDTIRQQSARITAFLEDMLLLAKSESGRLVLNMHPTDLVKLAAQAMEPGQILARLHGIALCAELPESLPSVSLDTDLFIRLLDNLISNAIKFSPANGCVTLRMEHLPASGQTGQGKLLLSVSDQGPGIPPALRKKLFENFATSETFAEHSKQIGLGLSFCRMVAESHNGRILASDNHPNGAVFTVEIPAG